MKKFLNLLFKVSICISMLFTFGNPFIAKASDILTESASGLSLSSFPTPYIPPEKIDSSTAFEDIYEYNDHYYDAVNLSPSNYYDLDLYRTKINATLDYNAEFIDMDYYYFKVLTDSYVTITINSNYSGLYDFSIYTVDYYDGENSNAYHTLTELSYDESTNNYRSYLNLTKPGTFYEFVKGKQTINVTIDYELNLYVEKNSNYPNVNVELMQSDERLKGVAWISDFVPVEMEMLPNLLDTIVYQDDGIVNLDCIDHALNDLANLNVGTSIPLATYYIWDPLLRYDIHQSLKAYYNILYNYFSTYDKIITDLEIKRNLATGAIELVGFIYGINGSSVILTKEISEIIGIGWSDILSSAVGLLFDIITPKIEISQVTYAMFISSLMAGFEVYVDSDATREEISESTDIKVVKIEFYYYLYTDLLDSSKKIISFDATMDEYDQSNYYTEDYFYPKNEIYTRGKLYGILESTDVGKLTGLSTTEELHIHNYSDYIWRDKSTHVSLCICGETKYEGHAVLNGSNICIKCGGTADTGFIEIMDKNIYRTSNGSYILSNGVIVLVDTDLEAYYSGNLVFVNGNLVVS